MAEPVNPAAVTAEDERLMDQALAEARQAGSEGEVPIGAVVAVAGQIVGRGRNARERLQDPTAHAEVLALQDASRHLGRWRLSDATVYSTLEPCPMCAGALVNARVARLVYAVEDPKAGATGTLFDITRDGRLNHRLIVDRGIRAEECSALLKNFFREKRRKIE